tara:strand:- start:10241 stop:10612 length:372 start_codon:yes stop_codon:yes gene_type:complete
MMSADSPITVFYDGACPRCRADRRRYEQWAGDRRDAVSWFDITGQDDHLRDIGIDPDAALRELHVQDRQGKIHRELDAYILLMARVPRPKPLAWLISLPVIRPVLSWLYRTWVLRRLERTGRT